MGDAVETVTKSVEVKPGYKTTEFWLMTSATMVGLTVASGVIPTEGPWAQVVGLVTGMLGALGYSVPRMSLKANAGR